MDNKELQKKYNEMHSKGSTSWFSGGKEERETILRMGEPWDDKTVFEIGCGEGDLLNMIYERGGEVHGTDYSKEAVAKANKKYPHLWINYWDLQSKCISPADPTYRRIVMQGVLEHLDDPFTELKWMIDNLLVKGGDVITSSPCFLNPRGIVWMTLDMLGAVMSKTDLHYLHPWQFSDFCKNNGYKMRWDDCDMSWGAGKDMILDLRQRLPLALRDGNIPYSQDRLDKLLYYLGHFWNISTGATMVYRIRT